MARHNYKEEKVQRRKTTGREKMQNFNLSNFYSQYSQPHFF